MRALPYPGHSWSFTQHAIGIEPVTLYGFLGCAALYEGETGNFGRKITESMIERGLLTPNVRDGVNDAWRDYQQILAELGLIYSATVSPVLRVTEAGHMFLAGEIGYADLMGMQALRYQYPNGQKSTIQQRLSQVLAAHGWLQPGSVIELQANAGVLVKPGALLLRLLIELFNSGSTPSLTIDECLAFVLPCRNNREWPLALAEIIAYRSGADDISHVNGHGRRNMQDWFAFLNKTELFDRNRALLSLSPVAIQRLSSVQAVLEAEEQLGAFWIPPGFNVTSRVTWFDWFGHINYSVQEIANHPLDEAYVAENFVAGCDEDAESVVSPSSFSREIVLKALDIDGLLETREFAPRYEVDQGLIDRINLGAFRRHSKTVLHDRIVALLAEKLQETGAALHEDRNSVDLLATWPDESEAIFEIKTVTMRSLSSRLRMAVGQVEEYAYRRKSTNSTYPDKIIVINAEIPATAWQVDFLLNTMEIGLLCTTGDNTFQGHVPAVAKTGQYWQR